MKPILLALSIIAATAGAALADGVVIEDAYARASGPTAKAGAAFMVLRNEGEVPVRLVGVASEIARKTELHTHLMDNGVMKMRPIEDGIVIEPGGAHEFARGGDHVMFMGLTAPMVHQTSVAFTLLFEDGAEVEVEAVVDPDR